MLWPADKNRKAKVTISKPRFNAAPVAGFAQPPSTSVSHASNMAVAKFGE